MEGNEKVCRRCGTLNHIKATMCIRCGENLEISEEDKYKLFKGKVCSEKLLSLFFIILFSGYLYLSIYYIFPFLYEILGEFSKSDIFEFYNNRILTKFAIETMYLVGMFLINYFVIAVILDIIFNKRFIKREKVNSMSLILYFFMTILIASILAYKYLDNKALMLEILISFLAVFPYIKRKIFKRSV